MQVRLKPDAMYCNAARVVGAISEMKSRGPKPEARSPKPEACLRSDRHLDQAGRPAALKAAAAHARQIVHRCVEHVVAGFAEGNRGDGLAVERAFAAGHGFNLRPLTIEL